MNLRELVIRKIKEAADEEFAGKKAKLEGQLTIEMATLGILPFASDENGEVDTVLAGVSAIADLLIPLICHEIADTILGEGPWCSNPDHLINKKTGKSVDNGSCPCYEFAASLAAGAGKYINSDPGRFDTPEKETAPRKRRPPRVPKEPS